MLSYFVLDLFSYSICLAGIIGLVRYKKIIKPYKPFFIFVWGGCVAEMISTLFVVFNKNNIAPINIYMLIESLLILYIFHSWSGAATKKNFWWLSALMLVLWVTDNLIIHSINNVNSFFRIGYSFVTVFLSVDQVNNMVVRERKSILRNARFIICLTFIVYYTYKATFEVFFVVKLPLSDYFYKNLFLIMVYVNLFANLLYAFASLWIPTRQKFTLPY